MPGPRGFIRQATTAADRAAAGRIKVMAGTGSNSTEEALRLTHHAAEAGADGALVVGGLPEPTLFLEALGARRDLEPLSDAQHATGADAVLRSDHTGGRPMAFGQVVLRMVGQAGIDNLGNSGMVR